MKNPSLVATILAGINSLDDPIELDQIGLHVNAHLRGLQRNAGLHIKVGDPVEFNSRTKPTYLIGEKAKVVDFGRTGKAKVVLDKGTVGRFWGEIRVPASLLTKL